MNSQGQRLFFEKIGSGEPLILVPGPPASHVAFLDCGLAAALAENFEVCLLDLTGLGRSDRATSMPTSLWCEDVISVMDAAAYPTAHIAGSAFGARIAARVANEAPDRVRTLLIDMPITGVTDAEDKHLSAMLANYAESPLAKALQRWHGELWREAMDFFIAARRQPGLREYYSPRAYINTIKAPTLICRSDEENPGHPLAMAFEWHGLADNSQLWIEPGAANPALTMVAPAEVARRYAQFAATHKPTR